MTTPGYRIKLHNALVTPILLMGVPRRLAILNGTLAAALTLGLRAYYLLPIFVAIHFTAMYFTKKDPYFFDVILSHLQLKKYYKV